MSVMPRLRHAFRRLRESRYPILRGVAWVASTIYGSLRVLRDIATDPDWRAIALLKLLRPGKVHQTTTLTFFDRYPQIFTRCAQLLNGREPLHLLSYGCSSGEEVLTLRQYFPAARIVGAEINPRALAACRQLSVDDHVRFVRSKPSIIQSHGPYDAIFCMAVLQRTPHTVESLRLTSIADLYPFERFNQQLSALDALLRPGGLLVVHHTQYRFTDADIAAKYDAADPLPSQPASEPYFDRRSQLVQEPVFLGSIFVKRDDGEPPVPGQLTRQLEAHAGTPT